MNISYNYGSASVDPYSELFGGLIAFLGGLMLVTTVAAIIMLICLWKIFSKHNRPGWLSLIPFVNTWVLFEITGIKGWLSLIPFVNIIFMLISYFKLAKLYGKSAAFGVGLVLLPIIFLPILVFSKSKENNKTEEILNEKVSATEVATNLSVEEKPVENIQMNQAHPIEPTVRPSVSTPNAQSTQTVQNQTPVTSNSFVNPQPTQVQPSQMNQVRPVEPTVRPSVSTPNVQPTQTVQNQTPVTSNSFVNPQPTQVQPSQMNPVRPVEPTVRPNVSTPNVQTYKVCPKCGNKLDVKSDNCFMCGTKF